MSSSTAIEPTNGNGNAAVVAEQPRTIKGWLNNDGFKAELARSLPRHCNADRMARIAITCLTRIPKLAECEPASFLKCLLDLSQWGLEPNGRDAHLIPFNNNKRGVVECQLILDYKGLVQLLYRSGQVLSVHADVVFEGDDFEFSMGQVIRHTPYWLRKDRKPDKQGNMIAAYARVELKGNAVKCEVMSKEQIDAIRKRSKAANSGPWVTDYEEMAKKTVFRRTTKWLPVSAEIIEAFERDDDRPAHFGGSAVIDADFVVPPANLNQLADQRKQRQSEADGTESSDPPEPEQEPDGEVTLTAVFGLVEAASTHADLDDIRKRFVGPDATEGAFAAGEWTEIDKLIADKRGKLNAKPAAGQSEMFPKGNASPD